MFYNLSKDYLIDYIRKIFDLLKKFENENDYYVNVILPWSLCELYIRYHEQTIIFLNNNLNYLNDFVINKFISKCKDSYRILDKDKKDLIKYKRKSG